MRGVSDAALVPPVMPDARAAQREVLQMKFDRWQPRPDASCAAAMSDEAWRCLSGASLVENEHISTPIFYHQDQRDPKTPGGVTDETGAAIRDLLAPRPGAFSPNAGFHIILNDPRFNRTAVDGHTMAEVLGNWYFGRTGPTNVIEGVEAVAIGDDATND